jgi:hypothetical protein
MTQNQDPQVAPDVTAVQVNSVFSMLNESEGSANDRDAIIKELLASGNARRVSGLRVKNVVATALDNHTLLTFVIKEEILGDVNTGEVDVFDKPILAIGKTHNVQTSTYAVAGAMKDCSPKLAIFANEVVDKPAIATRLFAGGSIDVVMQFVPKDTDYVNPFASSATPVRFERDKMIHHVIGLTLGEVGQDMYHVRISQ